MFRPHQSYRTFAPLIILTLLALTLGRISTARAESRPYRYRETGQFVSANDLVSTGEATHVGHFHGMGSVQFEATDDPAVLRFKGGSILTAANGDELHEAISGWLNLQTGEGTATVIFIGGTGRFAHASGMATALAQLSPGGTFEVAGEGTIDY